MKFSIRTIPAAAAMTAALMFGAQAYAQTGTTTVPGTTNPKDAPSPPPSAGSSKQMAPGMGNAPMGQGMGMNSRGSMNSKDAGAMSPGDAEQPTRQSGKVAKSKAERMEKGSKPKSSMNKSNEPVRESDLKDMPAK